MLVKIGDVTYDSNRVPIMLIVTPHDKALIADMAPEATKYCSYPEGMSQEHIREWMRE